MIEESPMPKASIVIPAYNAGAYIIKTLDSIVSQSLDDFECLVIDDGSTDNTAELVAAYHDARIRLIRQANSGGPASPRNQGVNQAKGEYIFMFDSDDIMLPDKLRVTVGALDAHPDVDIVFTNFQSINDAGELLNANYLQDYDTLWQLLPAKNAEINPLEPSALFNALIRVNFIGTSSVALRRGALSHVDHFNERLKNAEDLLFWVSFVKRHKAIFINRVFHQYRILDTGISRRNFTRRAPSKIQGLKYMRDLCETKEQKKSIDRQLANDYASLSSAHRRQGQYKKAIDAAFSGIRWGINRKTLRAVLTSIAAPIMRRENRKKVYNDT
jgi:glycosyltransferase involved in cell wall biosynthesis